MSESPRDAIEATLKLIEAELADEGFALKAGMILARKNGDQTHLIRAQAATRNKAGTMARFEISAFFESKRLAAWKKVQWPGRPAAVTKFDSLVDVLQLKFPGTPHRAEWDVVDPGVRFDVAKEAAAIIRAQALPWFELTSDPVLALAKLLAPSTHASLVYYAVAAGQPDAARARIAEIAAGNAAFAEVLENVRRNGKPSAYRNAFEPIAWAAVSAGIA